MALIITVKGQKYERNPYLRIAVRLPVWPGTDTSEEHSSANEDDKQPLHSQAMGLRGRVSGVREWNGNTSAATWQDEKRAGDGGGGVFERGWE